MRLFPDGPSVHVVEAPGADLVIHRGLVGATETPGILEQLLSEVAWRSDAIHLFGREVPIPRLTAWYGDQGRVYTYSGIRLEPLTWTQLLTDLRDRVEEAAGTPFNSVLVNLYRDGSDSVGLHTDDEPELGVDPVIASLSLGATRTLTMRRRDGSYRISIELHDGDLMVMSGTTQTLWMHGVPKVRRPVGPRLNLTFRTIR